MKRFYWSWVVAGGLLLGAGCSTVPEKNDEVMQVSTIDALLAGVYDGVMPLSELTQHGNLGIGTFEGLDGEMVLLDGQIYQVKADGKVYRPALNTKTPFAAVIFFHPENRYPIIKSIGYKDLCGKIDQWAPDRNLLLAFQIKGIFKTIKTRSVPKQNKPYPPLAEVTKTQPVFELRDVSGTIIGFRLPPYVKGINIPGYHLHFLSDDGSCGGHVLDFEMSSGRVEIDNASKFYMILPEDSENFSKADLGKDRSTELNKAEK